jgi:protein-L-isoaspartate O-methyltransferase
LTVLDYEHARHRMVDAHIARRGVRDERVLGALRRVARETFVDAGFEEPTEGSIPASASRSEYFFDTY